MSTKQVEITQVAQAMIRVFMNHLGNWFTVSGWKSLTKCVTLHSAGKKVLVFMPDWALKAVHTSQMMGMSQTTASTAMITL